MKFLCERKGPWNGYEIFKSKKGFVVDFWSTIQGETTGRRVFIPFSPLLPEQIDFPSMLIYADDIRAYCEMLPGSKVLRRGQTVQ